MTVQSIGSGGPGEIPDYSAYLLAYFLDEHDERGEQVRFAVSAGPSPTDWTVLNNGRPMLISTVGERGVRDPFLVRDGERFHLIATDLRIWPTHDWDRAVRTGSRSIVVWDSPDLVHWGEPSLIEIAPDNAGNAWAPKAYWSDERECWLVFFASAVFPGYGREVREYQRILAAPTVDFHTFGPAEIYLDRGHDVIDATFGYDREWFRFSVDADPPQSTTGRHVFMERGRDLEDTAYIPVAVDLVADEMERAEGPALAPALERPGWYLLLDEFGLRGYQLFYAESLVGGEWRLEPESGLPEGARHGSFIPITSTEQQRLMASGPGGDN